MTSTPSQTDQPKPSRRAARRPGAASLAAAFALALSARADTRATETGFLSDMSLLRPIAGDPEADRAYVASAPLRMETGPYSAVLVDPVAWRPAPTAPAVDADALGELLDGYRARLVAAFAERGLAEAAMPGPGVLRVRAAVTDVRRSIPVLNALTMIAAVVPASSGGASSEAEVLDAPTGRRVAALAAFNNGGRSFLGGPIGLLSEYGHARRALVTQADRLRDLALPAAGA